MNEPRLNLVQIAGMLPRDPEFREYVRQHNVPPRIVNVDEAAHFIRTVCEIESRRELESDVGAQRRFHSRIRKPFVAWRARQAEHA